MYWGSALYFDTVHCLHVLSFVTLLLQITTVQIMAIILFAYICTEFIQHSLMQNDSEAFTGGATRAPGNAWNVAYVSCFQYLNGMAESLVFFVYHLASLLSCM